MKTEEELKTDADGYILIPNTFIDKYFYFEFVKDLTNGWKIFRKKKKADTRYSYELVKPYKQESFTIAGVIMPKKWKYPTDEKWGVNGFTGTSVENCEEIFKKRGLDSKSADLH